jgi:hypothetical protein
LPSEAACEPAACAAPGLQLVECDLQHPLRDSAEAFVRNAYHRVHGARIATFFPNLLLLQGRDGSTKVAAGYRRAGVAPLFLERYLTSPIDVAISARFRVTVRRGDLVEVGNFASTSALQARRFMSELPAHLLKERFVWIAFTATATMRGLLDDIGAPYSMLGTARWCPSPDDVDHWGRYYDDDPRVIVGHLPSFQRRDRRAGRNAY